MCNPSREDAAGHVGPDLPARQKKAARLRILALNMCVRGLIFELSEMEERNRKLRVDQ